MKIISAKDYQALSRAAANIISAQVILKPSCVLGLATGSSPVGTYQQLIEWYKKGDLDFSQVRTVNLDEYVGLDKDHDQSYAYFMRTNLFDHINVDPANTNIPDGMAPDEAEECARYDKVIHDLGGIDLQLLGLGVNGHIGFNEPADAFSTGTHQVTPLPAMRPPWRPMVRGPATPPTSSTPCPPSSTGSPGSSARPWTAAPRWS